MKLGPIDKAIKELHDAIDLLETISTNDVSSQCNNSCVTATTGLLAIIKELEKKNEEPE